MSKTGELKPELGNWQDIFFLVSQLEKVPRIFASVHDRVDLHD